MFKDLPFFAKGTYLFEAAFFFFYFTRKIMLYNVAQPALNTFFLVFSLISMGLCCFNFYTVIKETDDPFQGSGFMFCFLLSIFPLFRAFMHTI